MEQPIRLKIGFNKNITVNKNGQYLNVYVNDNCFEKGQLVQAKSKSVWLKWEETLALRDAINSIEEQVICMGVFSTEKTQVSDATTPNAASKDTTVTPWKRQHTTSTVEKSDKTVNGSQRYQPYKKDC